MSVTGFSVQHDPEVQAYKQLRAAYLEEKAARKREEKIQLRQIREVRRAYLQNSKRDEQSIFSRIFHSRRSQQSRQERQEKMLLMEKNLEEKLMDSDSDSEMVSLVDVLKCERKK
ncbi:hypothetical protein RBB50_010460 [Rhinocladiella similis]